VHKATHHFDLLNWYLASDPSEVAAFGSLRHYGRNGPFRGERCRTCPHTAQCKFYFDVSKDPLLEMLYEDPSRLDGYVRDACVFREEIDIPDTMTATIRYANDVQVAYSVNTYMPIEGFHLAFNGKGGRLEIANTKTNPGPRRPPTRSCSCAISAASSASGWRNRAGGHFGGDDGLRTMLFNPASQTRLLNAPVRGPAPFRCCAAWRRSKGSRMKRNVSLQDLWGGTLPA